MCDEAATARQRYRIIKPSFPAAVSHWVGAIWAAAQSSVSPLPRPAWPSMHHIPGAAALSDHSIKAARDTTEY